nr:glycine-rich cell wall structural protein-like [Ipomoea batatas]
MGSKVLLLLGLSLAVFLMIASEVTARELAETTTSFDPNRTHLYTGGTATKAEKANGVAGDDKHNGDGYGGYGHGGGGYGHGGGGYGHGGGGYGHGGGGYGHGGGGYGHGDTVAAATATMEGAKGAAHTRGKRSWMKQSPKHALKL